MLMCYSLILSCCVIFVVQGGTILPEKFKFDATLSGKDNWGVPGGGEKKPMEKSGYYEAQLRDTCATQWKNNERPMSDLLKTATAIHSVDTPAYDDFVSTDLVPENRNLYGKMSPWGNEGKYKFNSVLKKSLKASNCHIDEDDGSHWVISRIGPFFTKGGYDWLQIGWDDIWDLESVLEEHRDGIYIIEQHMSPVYEDGTRIGNPPIHVHHIHIGPDYGGTYVRQRTDMFACAFRNISCFNPLRTMEIHGDYVCTEDEGGHDCHVEMFNEGYGKLITHSLGLEGEINDVRAVGSAELEWYWEVGARWVPRTVTTDGVPSRKAISLLNLAGPGTYDRNVQKSYLFTFPTPTDHQSMFWYSGRMKWGGELLRMKIHAHNNIFQESIFFAASPEQLGLTEINGFPQSTPHLTVNPTDIGFEDNSALKRFLLANLERSQKAFDSASEAGSATTLSHVRKAGGQCGFPKAPCEDTRPAVVCQVFGRVEVVDGFAFDRRSPTSCDPWQWPSGQVFTVIGFSEHRGYPLGPHLPGVNNVPKELAGHVGYWLSYDSKETPQQSHWSYSMYTHDPDGEQENVLEMSGYQKIAIILNGHTSPHFNDWTKTPHSVAAFIIYNILTNLVLTLVITLVLIAVAGRQMYKIYINLSDDAKHKKSDDLLLCPFSSSDPLSVSGELRKAGWSGGNLEMKRRGPGSNEAGAVEEEEDEEKVSLLAADNTRAH